MITQRIQIQAALNHACSVKSLVELAITFKSQGMTQAAMYRLFDEYRQQHEDDADETIYEALIDTLDIIAGWGPNEARLFETELPL
jgi:hypothetical protein